MTYYVAIALAFGLLSVFIPAILQIVWAILNLIWAVSQFLITVIVSKPLEIIITIVLILIAYGIYLLVGSGIDLIDFMIARYETYGDTKQFFINLILITAVVVAFLVFMMLKLIFQKKKNETKQSSLFKKVELVNYPFPQNQIDFFFENPLDGSIDKVYKYQSSFHNTTFEVNLKTVECTCGEFKGNINHPKNSYKRYCRHLIKYANVHGFCTKFSDETEYSKIILENSGYYPGYKFFHLFELEGQTVLTCIDSDAKNIDVILRKMRSGQGCVGDYTEYRYDLKSNNWYYNARPCKSGEVKKILTKFKGIKVNLF